MGMSFSPSDFVRFHRMSFTAWLLDLLPLLMAWIPYKILKYIDNKEQQFQQFLTEKEKYYYTVSSSLEKISKGDLTETLAEFQPDDKIGLLLNQLKSYLIKSKEAELKRREEDRQRNWITEGLAKFADLLRENNNNLTDLSYNIIIHLVKYLDANQGGIFLVEQTDGNKFLELKACYAWGRKKFAKARYEFGEDLVGACALEKDMIFMTDVPDNYIRIRSGLGDANPRCILIVPLMVNGDEIQGVIELASFKVFEPFEQEFIKKVTESIASTIYGVKNTLQTKKLLEQSQQQAEELAQQEEELRQNLEELRATQEQIALQSRELEVFTEAVNHSMLRAEFDMDARAIYMNDRFVKKMGYGNTDELIGKHISVFLSYRDQDAFFKIWNNVIENNDGFEGEIKFQTKQGKDVWLMVTIVPERSEYSNLNKIIFLATDITLQKELDLDFKAQIDALDRSSLKAQFLPDGMLVDGNENFCESMGVDKAELQKKSIFDLIAKEDMESFRDIWNKVLAGESVKGQFKQITFRKEEKWFQCTFTSMHNIYREIVKVIYIANDITEQKLMELETRKQAELLRQQEDKLRRSQQELTVRLEEARKEMAEQYKEIEKIKVRNEKTLEGAHDAIITFDKNGIIEFFNKSAEILWGYEKTDVLGQNVRILFTNKTIEEDPFVASIVNGIEKQVGVRKEIKIMKKNGEEVPVLLLLSEALIDNNEHTFTAFIQNIEVELF
ncbi:MAG: PAS domain S-box protein [Bacteroidales bacterium]